MLKGFGGTPADTRRKRQPKQGAGSLDQSLFELFPQPCGVARAPMGLDPARSHELSPCPSPPRSSAEL